MRQDLVNFYAFCRWSDDLGDEGDTLSDAGRTTALQRLEEWESDLGRCYNGAPRHPVFVAFQKTIDKYKIPAEPLMDLISAFKQDQIKTQYGTFSDLLDYCSRSANPVGRVYLMMFGYNDPSFFEFSDKTCTALQLANFWQDVLVDLQKGRIYIPQEDLKKFGYTQEELLRKTYNDNFRNLMEYQVKRTRELFNQGALLEDYLPLNISFEVTLFRKGGERLLEKIERISYNVLARRPVVSTLDKIWIFLSTFVNVRLRLGS
jgi:squalene synthase HpnC